MVERAWIRVAREEVGPEGHIVLQPLAAQACNICGTCGRLPTRPPPAHSASSCLGRRWGADGMMAFGALSSSLPRISSPTRRPAPRQIRLGTQVVVHPIGGRVAGCFWHGLGGAWRMASPTSTADATAGIRARVLGRGCQQQAAIPGGGRAASCGRHGPWLSGVGARMPAAGCHSMRSQCCRGGTALGWAPSLVV